MRRSETGSPLVYVTTSAPVPYALSIQLRGAAARHGRTVATFHRRTPCRFCGGTRASR